MCQPGRFCQSGQFGRSCQSCLFFCLLLVNPVNSVNPNLLNYVGQSRYRLYFSKISKFGFVFQEKVLKAESEFQERELQKMERERELAVLKRQHEREIYMLKRKLHETTLSPKTTNSIRDSTEQSPEFVRISIPAFVLSGIGSTSYVEYQVVRFVDFVDIGYIFVSMIT